MRRRTAPSKRCRIHSHRPGAAGFALIDVLVAVVILGFATAAIYQAVITGYGVIERAQQRQWAWIYGASRVAELDLGIERSGAGTLLLPGVDAKWQSVQAGDAGRLGTAVEVSWHGREAENVLKIYGFVDVTRSQ